MNRILSRACVCNIGRIVSHFGRRIIRNRSMNMRVIRIRIRVIQRVRIVSRVRIRPSSRTRINRVVIFDMGFYTTRFIIRFVLCIFLLFRWGFNYVCVNRMFINCVCIVCFAIGARSRVTLMNIASSHDRIAFYVICIQSTNASIT